MAIVKKIWWAETFGSSIWFNATNADTFQCRQANENRVLRVAMFRYVR